MEKTNFEKRLNRFGLTDAQKENCHRIHACMQSARSKVKDDLKKFAEHVSFAGFVKGMKKLILTDSRKGDSVLCLVPVEASVDLMNIRDLTEARPAPHLKSLGMITVYAPATVDEEPHLTTLDVLAQIPAEMADKVSVFCLHLEDKFTLNGYNLVAQAYEYKVELFSK